MAKYLTSDQKRIFDDFNILKNKEIEILIDLVTGQMGRIQKQKFGGASDYWCELGIIKEKLEEMKKPDDESRSAANKAIDYLEFMGDLLFKLKRKEITQEQAMILSNEYLMRDKKK